MGLPSGLAEAGLEIKWPERPGLEASPPGDSRRTPAEPCWAQLMGPSVVPVLVDTQPLSSASLPGPSFTCRGGRSSADSLPSSRISEKKRALALTKACWPFSVKLSHFDFNTGTSPSSHRVFAAPLRFVGHRVRLRGSEPKVRGVPSLESSPFIVKHLLVEFSGRGGNREEPEL